MTKRTGAKSRDTVDPLVLARLHDGSEESAALSEALAIDFDILLGHVTPDISAAHRQLVKDAQLIGITKRMNLVATVLAEHLGENAAEVLKQHKSDTVRGWAAYIIGKDSSLSLDQKLSAVYPLANDPHFGVREWAWLSLRTTIASDVCLAVKLLTPWAKSEYENIRRFAIEATRPRGVWSKHISELKESPQIGLELLDYVMEDPSRYVQDSCGNWLNDAAKSNPQCVVQYCDRWKHRSSTLATSYIIKRAMRNITPRLNLFPTDA